jgi:hypothetical protein
MANMSILTLLITFLASLFKSHRQLALENLALRQQVTIVPPEYPIVLKRPRTSKKSKIPGSTALPIWMGKKKKNNGL